MREDKESEGRRGKLGAISIWLAFGGYISDWYDILNLIGLINMDLIEFVRIMSLGFIYEFWGFLSIDC